MVRAFFVAAAVVGSVAATGGQSADLVFLTRDGCVQTDRMRANLDAALRQLKRTTDYTVIDADTLGAKDVRRGYGTPTVLSKGRDLFGMPEPEPAEHSPT